MSAIIAIDVGGSQLRVNVYPPDGTTPKNEERGDTRGQKPGAYDRLTAVIDKAWPDEPVAAISVAVPGPVNPRKKIVIKTPNIPEWKNYPLAKKLTDRYHVPVFLGNDANLAALGEWRYGAGQGHHDLVYLTISTGIGGGVIIADRLLEGSRGMAAELGHVTVLPDGPLCSCGVHGHLEALASGLSIVRYVKEKIAQGQPSSLEDWQPSSENSDELTSKEVAKAALQGDALAKEAFIRAGEFIGQATADFLHAFNPTIVIFGGGVSKSWSLLDEAVQDSMRRHVMAPAYLDDLKIVPAELGDDAGLLGALAQAHLRLAKD